CAEPFLVRPARPHAPRLPPGTRGRPRRVVAGGPRRRPAAGRAIPRRAALLPGVVRPPGTAGADERDARTRLGLRRRPARALGAGAGAARDALLRRRARGRGPRR